MTIVGIHLLASEKMVEFYKAGIEREAQGAKAAELFEQGFYSEAPAFTTHLKGEDAAEEAFDLTNNPNRDDDRAYKYGRKHRSVSSGDIVCVDDRRFVCCSFGWEEL